MDAASIAARKQPVSWVVQLFKWATPDFTLRLSTGGFVPWGNEVFLARDPVMGVLGELPTFEDGIDSQTTRSTLTIIPPDQAGLAKAADRKYQRTLVQVWDATLDGDTGTLIGEPDLLFRGLVDFPRVVIGESWEVVLECGTEEALLNEPNEDRRLSNPFHQSVWPGELGLAYVTGLGRKVYWRANAPAGTGGGGYVSGGGGGGGNYQAAY